MSVVYISTAIMLPYPKITIHENYNENMWGLYFLLNIF